MYITDTSSQRGHNQAGKGLTRQHPLGGATGNRRMTGCSKHILVVDDNGDVRDVIVEILQEQNYRVSSATGGSVMRDFLETGDTVDCVILDALMPGDASASLAFI
jgi:PleD family two-component response regulator